MDIIKVSANSRTSAVAGAIAGVIREHKHAEVQAIGAGAVNQAMKALVLASAYLKEDGIHIVCFIAKKFTELLLSKGQGAQLTRRQEQDLNEKALSLAGRVNRQKMIEAALMVSEAIDRALTILSAENISLLRPEFTGEQITINTAVGEVIIGGFGSNRYSGRMPALLIDVGGDDEYCFASYNPLSVIIDISGNDTYASVGSASHGAGIMGMGFLVDRAGDDHYSAQNSSFGTGLFGTGFLLDERGDDAYSCQTLTEGASSQEKGWEEFLGRHKKINYLFFAAVLISFSKTFRSTSSSLLM